MGDVEVENHPVGEENNMQEMQHEMNPEMAQIGGHHDPSRGPPDQVNYPGSEQGSFSGQPLEGQPQEGSLSTETRFSMLCVYMLVQCKKMIPYAVG